MEAITSFLQQKSEIERHLQKDWLVWEKAQTNSCLISLISALAFYGATIRLIQYTLIDYAHRVPRHYVTTYENDFLFVLIVLGLFHCFHFLHALLNLLISEPSVFQNTWTQRLLKMIITDKRKLMMSTAAVCVKLSIAFWSRNSSFIFSRRGAKQRRPVRRRHAVETWMKIVETVIPFKWSPAKM